MTPGPASAALIFAGFAVLVAGAWAWMLVAMKVALTWRLIGEPLAGRCEQFLLSLGYSPRLPLLVWRERRPVPWALLDLFLIVVLQIAAAELLRGFGLITDGKLDELAPAQKKSLIAMNAGLSLMIGIAGVLWMVVRAGATLRDLGWSPRTLTHDLRLGVIGFVMLAPPVYGLQGLLVVFWKESKHPIVEMFKASPESLLFALLVFSAVIIAPLFEELMFRVLLQSFLEKVFCFRNDPIKLLFGNFARELPAVRIPTIEGELDPESNPKSKIQNPKSDEPELRGYRAWLPIGISSAIFALLHYSHGPDWIPLLLLAAGMGYLYQRTHSILPSLVVHLLLNGMSMWALWVTVKE